MVKREPDAATMERQPQQPNDNKTSSGPPLPGGGLRVPHYYQLVHHGMYWESDEEDSTTNEGGMGRDDHHRIVPRPPPSFSSEQGITSIASPSILQQAKSGRGNSKEEEEAQTRRGKAGRRLEGSDTEEAQNSSSDYEENEKTRMNTRQKRGREDDDLGTPGLGNEKRNDVGGEEYEEEDSRHQPECNFNQDPPKDMKLPASLRCAICDLQNSSSSSSGGAPSDAGGGQLSKIMPRDVAQHIDSAAHQKALAKYYGIEDSLMCPVSINGKEMLLDNYVIFPKAMFGNGACLYSNTLHLLLAPDACGGVRLRPGHKYTVVALSVAAPGASFAMTSTDFHNQLHRKGNSSSYFDLRTHFTARVNNGAESGEVTVQKAIRSDTDARRRVAQRFESRERRRVQIEARSLESKATTTGSSNVAPKTDDPSSAAPTGHSSQTGKNRGGGNSKAKGLKAIRKPQQDESDLFTS